MTGYQIAYSAAGPAVAHIGAPGPEDATGQRALCGARPGRWGDMMPVAAQHRPEPGAPWCPSCVARFEAASGSRDGA